MKQEKDIDIGLGKQPKATEPKVVEKSETETGEATIFDDGSASITCSMCSKLCSYEANSVQARRIISRREHLGTEIELWKCGECYQQSLSKPPKPPTGSRGAELQDAGIPSWAIGQALNMAQRDLIARGIDSTNPSYWETLEQLKLEFLKKAVLK